MMEMRQLPKKGGNINATSRVRYERQDQHLSSEDLHDFEGNDTEVVTPGSIKWSRSSIGLILASCYTLIILLQWLLVCILSRRPMSTLCDNYNVDVVCNWSVAGKPATLDNFIQVFRINARWIRATQVLASGLGVLMIPLTTAVCARAVATMTQADTKAHGMTLMQTLAFANKGWMDPMFFCGMISNRFARKAMTPFFCLCLILTVIGASIFPLQAIVVTRPFVPKAGPVSEIKTIAIEGTMTALRYGYTPHSNFSLGGTSRVLDFQAALSQASLFTRGQYYMDSIWHDNTTQPGLELSSAAGAHWTSFFSTNVSTGFLRNYSLGIGSSVKCSAADFPSECVGENPFTFDISDSDPATISLRLCIPGDMYQFPWQTGIEGPMQNITEILYMAATNSGTQSSIACTCNTTSGYFELPNDFDDLNDLNDSQPRALLSQYSLANTGSAGAFNPSSIVCDIPELILDTTLPSSILNTSLPDLSDYDMWSADCNKTGYPWTSYHGPLLSSVIVLFTNATNKNQCREGICSWGYNPAISNDVGSKFIPSWVDYGPYESLSAYSYYWQYLDALTPVGHNDDSYAELMEGIFQGMTYLASQSALQLVGATDITQLNGQGLQAVQTLGSVSIERVDLSIRALIGLSILIAIYTAGMLCMGIWGSGRESWTPTLDALAMLTLGARLHDKLPPLEGHPLDGVAAMGEEYDGISGSILHSQEPLLSRADSHGLQ